MKIGEMLKANLRSDVGEKAMRAEEVTSLVLARKGCCLSDAAVRQCVRLLDMLLR